MTDQEDFAALFGEYEKQHAQTTSKAPKIGDTVKGTIVSIQGDSAYVDLGSKTEGIVEIEELTDADGNILHGVGDSIEISVSGIDESTGTLLLGSRHARHVRGNEGLRQAFQQKIPVEGRVSGVVKGGLEVEISGERAFCPASQIGIHFVEDLQEFVGEKLAFRITKFEGGRHTNLVVSRRSLLEEEQQALASETRSQLEVGAVLKGRVTSLKEYGAFIDLGGIEGMVHISELAFGRVKHPQDVLSVGQPVEVAVLRIEQTDNPKRPEKIALSIRALEKDPWQDVVNQYPIGSLVQGVVSRLQPFGAFIEIAPGIDALVHISELGSGRRIDHPQEVLSVGDKVEASVVSVDSEKHRIGLSLDKERKSHQDSEQDLMAKYKQPNKSFGTLGDLLKKSMNKE